MSIQNTRIRLLTEEILKRNLQQGLLPDSQEFIWQLEQALREAGRNGASFRFRPYRNTEVAQSQKYNQDNQRIQRDLEALYQNLGGLHAALNKHYQYFDTEKNKLEKQMDVLENRLKAHIQNAGRPGILPYAYDTFDDTTKVDLANSQDVFVDTKNNAVHLVEEKRTTRRLYPGGKSAFRLLPEKLDRKEDRLNGSLPDILSDSKDRIWQHQVRLKEDRSLTGVLTLQFDRPQHLNRISSTFLTVKPFRLRVTYSPDGSEWFELPNYIGAFEAQKQVALDFPSVPMLQVRLEMEKAEADEVKVDGDRYDFRYLFGLENLALYNKQYPTKGIFQSRPLDLLNEPEHYAVQTVSLHADEWLPTGTDIQYELALNEAEPEWHPIDPAGRAHPVQPQTLSFLRMTKNGGETLYFPEHFSRHQSEAEDLLVGGIPLYRLTQLQDGKEGFSLPPRHIREGSTRLYVGKDHWELTSFPASDVTGLPELSDYQGVFDGTTVAYLPLHSGRGGDLLRNVTATTQRKYLARLGLHLKEARTVTATPVATEPMSIYLNGERVYTALPGDAKETYFVFRPGWNELVVLVNGQNATSVNGMSVALGFSPQGLTETLYARSTPLSEVSLFDLQYNTKQNDRTVFAKRRVADGWEILTNFWSAGLTFTLHYDYKAEELPAHEQFLLRATFLREAGESVPTPILRSYRLECT